MFYYGCKNMNSSKFHPAKCYHNICVQQCSEAMTNDPITSVVTIQLSRGDLSYPGLVTNFFPQLLSC